MSENLDLVRSIYADWERGDFSNAAWADPDIEYVLGDGPAPGTWTGLAGMAAGFGEFLNVWENYGVAVDEYRELDGERTLVFVRQSGRGKTSGLDLAQMGGNGAMLFDVRGGKVTRMVTYFDRDHALADLGLASEGGFPP